MWKVNRKESKKMPTDYTDYSDFFLFFYNLWTFLIAVLNDAAPSP
jgi:hypothetical protein